jgi:hypothetical protein
VSPRVPGSALVSPAGLASAALIVVNDLWLKRHHPGLLSGKLSDVGLCVFLPLVVLAIMEWIDAARRHLVRGVNGAPASNVSVAQWHVLACLVAGSYFVAVKCWPTATAAHVMWVNAIAPGLRARAVSDPSDLLCLPAMVLAWRTMRSSAFLPVACREDGSSEITER